MKVNRFNFAVTMALIPATTNIANNLGGVWAIVYCIFLFANAYFSFENDKPRKKETTQ